LITPNPARIAIYSFANVSLISLNVIFVPSNLVITTFQSAVVSYLILPIFDKRSFFSVFVTPVVVFVVLPPDEIHPPPPHPPDEELDEELLPPPPHPPDEELDELEEELDELEEELELEDGVQG
jgi:hypothetical protein